MDPVLAFLAFPAAAVVLIVFAFGWERWREGQRSTQLTAWASGLGFSIETAQKPPGGAGLSPALIARPVFSRGSKPHLVNIMEGRAADGHVVILDHVYVTGSGKNSSTISQTILAVELPPPPLPEFTLSPEGIFARIGQVFGSQDIDFDSHPEFSAVYQLKGDDEEAIRSLFERNAVPYLAEHRGWSVEASGAWILAYRHNRRVKVADMSAFFEEALTVVRVIATGGR